MCASAEVVFASGNRHCTLAVAFYYLCLHLLSTQGRSKLRKILKCVNLKFTVYDCKQTDIHMYLCNAVQLVWRLPKYICKVVAFLA